MKTACIIPVNKLNNIKSRLSNFFNIEQRIELNIEMLKDVLLAVKYSKNIDETYIITPDKNVINIIKKFKCRYLLEEKKVGVNIAVQKAISKSITEGATAAIILPSDIPLISSHEIDKIIDYGKDRDTVIITPAKRFDGTNSLFLHPPKIINTYYDQNSFTSHYNEAVKKNSKCNVLLSKNIMLDLDSISDLKEFVKIKSNTNTWKYLNKLI
tara:strand:- start:257 stop:892 length:636 start_codon:yes stop_codon:yes gene_type:complete